MFILVNDGAADDDGDLVLPAQLTTPNAINFMARHCRGLICLALTKERVDELALPAMNPKADETGRPSFTLSIEAKNGVSTGISAADRARTILVAADRSYGRDAIVSPGHVFPVTAHPGGVLMRAGRTEGATDVVRLAGLNAAGVMCRILRQDGGVARLKDLHEFAAIHGLKIGTIRDLIAFRRLHDKLIERDHEEHITLAGGQVWTSITYRNRIDGLRHDVLVKGDILPNIPTLVRMHRLSLFDDVLGVPGARSRLLQRSIDLIEQEGAGVIVLLYPAADHAYAYGRAPLNDETDLRSYGLGAQILSDLGVQSMVRLTDTQNSVVAVQGFGIDIIGARPILA
ncbi:3,4-dihydroxy-2-butanone-4-phosphate synthase [Sphingobium sp. H39-3-25]|uniref:3,4-dihydroxy-2-butanone-4-phosphate synthase n=1 Tax=Sphingobium arseniciresistens TaxID=3030834 RepID=UPI0023BA1690|nr:3,4-dihydroxy-2-butanone-4-phosphate synthase [Sphingobium arseniciresistens]